MREINADPDIKLRAVVADMPERHFLRGLIAISGRFSCEICIAEGTTGKSMSWPYPEHHGHRLREHDEMEGIAR